MSCRKSAEKKFGQLAEIGRKSAEKLGQPAANVKKIWLRGLVPNAADNTDRCIYSSNENYFKTQLLNECYREIERMSEGSNAALELNIEMTTSSPYSTLSF